MGRVPIQKLIITWLKLACCIRDLEKRKFYGARELYDIYNVSTPNTIVNKSYQIQSFCLQLNKIVNNNMITNKKGIRALKMIFVTVSIVNLKHS